MTDFRIVFMGTPEFALPSLEILMNRGYKVVGVVTSPDKPKGRGKQISGSAVKRYGLEHGLNILQPVNLKDEGFVRELHTLAPDLQVVVAFRKLPEIVWKIPSAGTINLHASLLPDYRGAAPINWAIINGETITGVTTFFINHEIDTGKIILREEEEIYPDDDAGSLHDRLMRTGAELVLKTVELIQDGKVNPFEQASTGILNLAPKIEKEICRIDFNKSATGIINLIRGLSPYPGAWTTINSSMIKIYKAIPGTTGTKKAPGDYETDNRTFLRFQTGSGVIDIIELQAEGKKRMEIKEFLRGNKL